MEGPVGRRLEDGRLHFQHGPIDLIVTLDGPADAVEVAARRGWERFQTILGELASELEILRQPLEPDHPPPCGEGRGGGCADPSSLLRTVSRDFLNTPTLNPSPQGGGKFSGRGGDAFFSTPHGDLTSNNLPPPPCGEGRGGGCADPSLLLRAATGDILSTPALNPSPQGGGRFSGRDEPVFKGDVARAMARACQPFAARFITPMAAVAGAVADEILASMRPLPPLRRALINNGGDIAFYLGEGETVTIGLAARPEDLEIAGTITLSSADPTRGVATSGWRGRSQSLGIADAVTVLAENAASADAAATMIANAVNIDHPAIARLPAREVKDDSDLGDRPVTVAVGPLPDEAVAQALKGGGTEAMRLLQAGSIHGAVLLLQGQIRVIGTAEHRSQRVLQSCP
ncbi:MAG: UPF0280 family protein [Hyphomicrobiales bacterium]